MCKCIRAARCKLYTYTLLYVKYVSIREKSWFPVIVLRQVRAFLYIHLEGREKGQFRQFRT